jgi:hypothetical protein
MAATQAPRPPLLPPHLQVSHQPDQLLPLPLQLSKARRLLLPLLRLDVGAQAGSGGGDGGLAARLLLGQRRLLLPERQAAGGVG